MPANLKFVRLFTGISLPSDIIASLTRLMDALRPTARLRWTPQYNIHITTKFIGEWPEARLPELQRVLSELPAREPFDVTISGVGWFPNPHSPRVLFAGVKNGYELERLAADTEEATATLGVERERKHFHPHLTLARIKDAGVRISDLRAAIAQLTSTDFGSFQAGSFQLFSSHPGPAGTIYTQLAEFLFKRS